METETKEKQKERKVLDFNDRQYQLEMAALETMAQRARVFQDAWTSQPILKATTFELRHLQGIISHGCEYIESEIGKLIAAKQDAELPGLSKQLQAEKIQLVNVDAEKINRTADSIKQKHPADRHHWINHRMIDVVKGQVCITEETKARLKDQLTIFADDNPKLAKINEVGTLTASSATMLMDIMKERKEQKEKLSGFKLPDQDIKLFKEKKPGISNQKPGPLSYQDGKVVFNLQHFI